LESTVALLLTLGAVHRDIGASQELGGTEAVRLTNDTTDADTDSRGQ
jgi:hypothetical protein